MRITFLLPGYVRGPSGGARVVYEYASRLAARGHQVTVVHPRSVRPPGPQKDQTPPQRARAVVERLRNLARPPVIDWHPVHTGVKLLFVPRADVSHLPDGDAIFATAWHTVGPVLECPPQKGHKYYLIQGYETWLGPKELVDATWRAPLRKVVVSRWLLEQGEKMGYRDISLIPNGIDHQRYLMSRPIRGRAPQVAMMFSSTPLKGAQDAIEALQMVHEKNPALTGVLFGVCRLDRPIPRWMTYYRNPPQDFLIDTIYNTSQAFLSASWIEGFSLPPAEAAACGCAVVSTDSLGIREFIVHGTSGLLSRPRDPQSLAANLGTVLGDEELRVRLAEEGRRSVLRLDWARSVTALESLITPQD